QVGSSGGAETARRRVAPLAAILRSPAASAGVSRRICGGTARSEARAARAIGPRCPGHRAHTRARCALNRDCRKLSNGRISSDLRERRAPESGVRSCCSATGSSQPCCKRSLPCPVAANGDRQTNGRMDTQWSQALTCSRETARAYAKASLGSRQGLVLKSCNFAQFMEHFYCLIRPPSD